MNKVVWDLDRPLETDCTLELLKFEDEEAQAVSFCWHLLDLQESLDRKLQKGSVSVSLCGSGVLGGDLEATDVMDISLLLWGLDSQPIHNGNLALGLLPSVSLTQYLILYLPRLTPPHLSLHFQVYWHSSAHIMGEAMERVYGGCLCYGPPIENGFYYDMYLEEG